MYSTKVNGEVLEFGTSGFLFQSNKLMYDRKTNSLWHQFRGEPVIGELAHSGITLEVIPVALTTWKDWVSTHPDTTVLDVETGVYPVESYLPESDRASVYFNYRERSDTIFPVAARSQLLPTKAQVFGLTFNGRERAYPLETLEQEPVINDSLGGVSIVVVTPDKGGGTRAFQALSHRFVEVREEAETTILLDDTGQKWRLEEDGLVNTAEAKERLPRLASRNSYWFGWYGFYPSTEVYGLDQSSP